MGDLTREQAQKILNCMDSPKELPRGDLARGLSLVDVRPEEFRYMAREGVGFRDIMEGGVLYVYEDKNFGGNGVEYIGNEDSLCLFRITGDEGHRPLSAYVCGEGGYYNMMVNKGKLEEIAEQSVESEVDGAAVSGSGNKGKEI